VSREGYPNPCYCLGEEDQVKLEILCQNLNKDLAAVTPPQVQLLATRWTAKGNLVITGGPAATPHTLQLAAPHISASLSCSLHLSSDTPISQPRPNTKWSKITINSVPTGASQARSPYSPNECHVALAASNPTYASLSITQQPSWVCPPTSYKSGSISSLSVAFEDPDGRKLKVLLAKCYLYAHGNRATVLKWKYHQKNSKGKSKSTVSEHAITGKDVDHLLSTSAPRSELSYKTASAPPAQSSLPTRKSTRTTRPPQPFDA